MRLIFNAIFSPELKEYLLAQNGVISVEFTLKDFMTEANIEFTDGTNPIIIMKHIELFEKYKYSNLVEFDKVREGKTKILKYIVDDMCCEYCYMGLVMDLFENDRIKSVKSNFDFKTPAFNIEFIIEYDEKYEEKDLIKYIQEKYN